MKVFVNSVVRIGTILRPNKSPFGESGIVIIGEVIFEDLFLLLLVITEPITPSAA